MGRWWPERPVFPPKPLPERITWDQRAALEVLEPCCLKLADLPQHPGLKQRVLHSLVDAGLARYLPRFRKWCITDNGRTALQKDRALRP